MVVLHSYLYCEAIPKISQAKGLRDPECGCTFEPFGFIKAVEDGCLECRRALPGETEVLGGFAFRPSLSFKPPPPVWVASAVIGQVASRLPVRMPQNSTAGGDR